MKSIFINPDATRDYYLIADTDKQYKFVLGVIDSLSIYHIRQTISNTPEAMTVLAEYLRFGLKNVEGPDVNFETEIADIPYLGKKTVVKRSFIEGLSRDVIAELAHEIAKDNSLLPEESKN